MTARILDRQPNYPVPGSAPWYRRRVRVAWRRWRTLHREYLAFKRVRAGRVNLA